MGEVLADAKDHDERLARTARRARAAYRTREGRDGLPPGRQTGVPASWRSGAVSRAPSPRRSAWCRSPTRACVAGWVSDVLGAHTAEVGRYKGGETKLLQFFLGQVMKASRGKADPKATQRLLEERLTS